MNTTGNRTIPSITVSKRRHLLLELLFLELFELMITLSLLFYTTTATASLRSVRVGGFQPTRATSQNRFFFTKYNYCYRTFNHPILPPVSSYVTVSPVRLLSLPETSSSFSELAADNNTIRKNRVSFISHIRSFVKISSSLLLKNRYSRFTNTVRNMTSSSNNNNNNDTNNTSTGNNNDPIEAITKGSGALAIQSSTPTPKKNSRFVYGSNDRLFGCIEEQHSRNGKPFGNVLDAGTGLHSIRWLCTLPSHGMTQLTAITADKSMQIVVQNEINDLITILKDETITPLLSHDDCNVLIGNWFLPESIPVISSSLTTNSQRKSIEEQLQQGEVLFDTILADYLIGAMDGFSPYCQDLMLPKLLRYLNPNGGMVHIVGLQPLPDQPNVGDDAESHVICRVRQVRDACILLAGHRCYREYPVEWIIRQIEIQQEHYTTNNIGTRIELTNVSRFPILYSYDTVLKQINVGRSKLALFPNKDIASAMERTLQDLQNECQQVFTKKPKIQLGFDYVVTISSVQQS